MNNQEINFPALTEDELNELDGPHTGFEIGQTIRAFSFHRRTEYYLMGEIKRLVRHPHHGAYMYEIEITKNTENPDDDSTIGWIPMSLAWGEWDDRIQLIHKAQFEVVQEMYLPEEDEPQTTETYTFGCDNIRQAMDYAQDNIKVLADDTGFRYEVISVKRV